MNKFFIQENAIENISCKITAIISWSLCVKSPQVMLLSKMEKSFARHEEGFNVTVPFQWGIM